MEITKMTISDLEEISDILETEFDDFWNANILRQAIKNTNSHYIVCRNKNEIIGFAGIKIIFDSAELENIVVKKSHRGKGFSTAILNEMIKIAKQKKCRLFNLEVSSANNIAIKLYEKLGFKKVGIRKRYYNGIDGFSYTKYL